MKCQPLKILSSRFIIFLLFISVAFNISADELETDANTLTGAGAHFAWVIFDSLKDELEQTTDKKIQLFGKNSNLGMGCNSGIKLAQMNKPGHETFGFVCCPLSQQEMDKKNIISYPLAEEPILILVNKKNPVENLSADQVRSIFSGEITNWNSVGGWDKPIVVITRLHCKKRPGHWKTILPGAEHFTENRLDVSSAKDMIKLMTSFDTSFGHVGATWIFDETSNVKAIKVDNIKPTAANLKNNSYPFHRRLSAITNMHPSKSVLKTIEQVQYGKSFDAVAKKFNLLPLNVPSAK